MPYPRPSIEHREFVHSQYVCDETVIVEAFSLHTSNTGAHSATVTPQHHESTAYNHKSTLLTSITTLHLTTAK